MTRTIRRFPFFLLLCAVWWLGLRCTPGDVAGGSGSTTTNGFTATIVDSQGDAVADAVIHVRPEEYCASGSGPAVAMNGTVADTFSGTDGAVALSNLQPGRYTIEAFDVHSGQGAVVRSVIENGPARDIGSLKVEPAGAIRGALDAELLKSTGRFGVQIYGMERFALVDSATGTYQFTDLPPAEYTLRLVNSDTSFNPRDIDTVAVTSADTVAIDPYTEWNHSARLLIHPAAAGLSASDTVFNFPLLLRLDGSNFDFSTERKKGNGLRVTKEDGGTVPFEQEWWDSANGIAALWLHIDTLFGSREVQTLRLYWGNSTASQVSSSLAVFDTAFGFEGVWHLNESGGTEQEDATVNNRSGVPFAMDGANDIPGIIGRSQEFEEDSQRILFDSLQIVNSGRDNNFTVSLWVKAAGVPDSAQGIFSRDDGAYGLYLDTGTQWVLNGDAPGFPNGFCTASATVEQWVHLCCVRRDGLNVLYVNGRATDSSEAGSSGSVAAFSDFALRLGGFSNNSGWFYGVIDEFRIYRYAVPEKRIRLCYETQREDQSTVEVKQ